MNARVWLCLALSLLLGVGCGVIKSSAGSPSSKVARAVRATRVAAPPVLDGRLDDACWKGAEEITGFLAFLTTLPARWQSLGYVCFDEANLYIGMKCLLPAGVKPAGEPRPQGRYPGGDDIVEIMVDPGMSGTDYYQLVTSAYGARFGAARHEGGAVFDVEWNSDWQAAAHIGEGYWSVELAIPFHTLRITPRTGSTWGLNLCRYAPLEGWFELSAVARNGEFNSPSGFVALAGMTADFGKYAFEIGASEAELTLEQAPRLAVSTPVTNRTGKRRSVRIDRHFVEDGAEKSASVSVALAPEETFRLPLETVGSADVLDRVNQVYFKTEPLRTRKIVVTDTASGAVLSSVPMPSSAAHLAMWLDVDPAWHAEMTGEATDAVKARVTVDVAAAQRRSGTLHVALVSKDSGRIVAEKTVAAPERITAISFPAAGIPWDAYEMRAAFTDKARRELLKTRAPALVLPGGKERIEVFNNFVSELMNAKERGLLGETEIDFMNPRDGWCYFSMSGHAELRLDGIESPILPVKAWGNPFEAMRHLKAGRHTLTITRPEGGRLGQLIVRAIPALFFDFYGAKPTIAGHGPWDWEFMGKHILPHVNTMISVRGVPHEPEHIELWKKIGRSWIWQTKRPDALGLTIDAVNDENVEKVFKAWSETPGYQHPLMDGVICDEFGSGNRPIYDVYTRAIEKLNAEFPNRTFSPYVAGATYHWGLYNSSKLTVAAMAGGGYAGPEYYLPQQRTRERAEEYIAGTLTGGIRRWNDRMPGSIPRVTAVLSFHSGPPMISDLSSGNHRVFMDMQMRGLATESGCFGLGGVEWYRPTYTDREYVRWAAHLFRHYCIEGRTEPAAQDPYELSHVLNPEFVDGTAGWEISPAEEGAIRTERYLGYGILQGRYLYRSAIGETFLVTRRSAKGPNIVRQTIRNLAPGKLYALRMLTGDYGHLVNGVSQQQRHAVSIKLDGAEILDGPRNSFHEPYRQGKGSWRAVGKFEGGRHPYWSNYHWRVFKAKGKTATLTISDWAGDEQPSGPIVLPTTWSNPPGVEGFTGMGATISNPGEGGNPGGFLKGVNIKKAYVHFRPVPYLRDNWGVLFGTKPGTISFDVIALDDYTIPQIVFKLVGGGGHSFRYYVRTKNVLGHSQTKADGWVRYLIPWQATWDTAQAKAKGWQPNRDRAEWSKAINNPIASNFVILGSGKGTGNQTVGIDNFRIDGDEQPIGQELMYNFIKVQPYWPAD